MRICCGTSELPPKSFMFCGTVYAKCRIRYYTHPTLESNKVEGLICPYNERVDIELDGQKLERPDTHFGKSKVGQKPSIV